MQGASPAADSGFFTQYGAFFGDSVKPRTRRKSQDNSLDLDAARAPQELAGAGGPRGRAARPQSARRARTASVPQYPAMGMSVPHASSRTSRLARAALKAGATGDQAEAKHSVVQSPAAVQHYPARARVPVSLGQPRSPLEVRSLLGTSEQPSDVRPERFMHSKRVVVTSKTPSMVNIPYLLYSYVRTINGQQYFCQKLGPPPPSSARERTPISRPASARRVRKPSFDASTRAEKSRAPRPSEVTPHPPPAGRRIKRAYGMLDPSTYDSLNKRDARAQRQQEREREEQARRRASRAKQQRQRRRPASAGNTRPRSAIGARETARKLWVQSVPSHIVRSVVPHRRAPRQPSSPNHAAWRAGAPASSPFKQRGPPPPPDLADAKRQLREEALARKQHRDRPWRTATTAKRTKRKRGPRSRRKRKAKGSGKPARRGKGSAGTKKSAKGASTRRKEEEKKKEVLPRSSTDDSESDADVNAANDGSDGGSGDDKEDTERPPFKLSDDEIAICLQAQYEEYCQQQEEKQRSAARTLSSSSDHGAARSVRGSQLRDRGARMSVVSHISAASRESSLLLVRGGRQMSRSTLEVQPSAVVKQPRVMSPSRASRSMQSMQSAQSGWDPEDDNRSMLSSSSSFHSIHMADSGRHCTCRILVLGVVVAPQGSGKTTLVNWVDYVAPQGSGKTTLVNWVDYVRGNIEDLSPSPSVDLGGVGRMSALKRHHSRRVSTDSSSPTLDMSAVVAVPYDLVQVKELSSEEEEEDEEESDTSEDEVDQEPVESNSQHGSEQAAATDNASATVPTDIASATVPTDILQGAWTQGGWAQVLAAQDRQNGGTTASQQAPSSGSAQKEPPRARLITAMNKVRARAREQLQEARQRELQLRAKLRAEKSAREAAEEKSLQHQAVTQLGFHEESLDTFVIDEEPEATPPAIQVPVDLPQEVAVKDIDAFWDTSRPTAMDLLQQLATAAHKGDEAMETYWRQQQMLYKALACRTSAKPDCTFRRAIVLVDTREQAELLVPPSLHKERILYAVPSESVLRQNLAGVEEEKRALKDSLQHRQTLLEDEEVVCEEYDTVDGLATIVSSFSHRLLSDHPDLRCAFCTHRTTPFSPRRAITPYTGPEHGALGSPSPTARPRTLKLAGVDEQPHQFAQRVPLQQPTHEPKGAVPSDATASGSATAQESVPTADTADVPPSPPHQKASISFSFSETHSRRGASPHRLVAHVSSPLHDPDDSALVVSRGGQTVQHGGATRAPAATAGVQQQQALPEEMANGTGSDSPSSVAVDEKGVVTDPQSDLTAADADAEQSVTSSNAAAGGATDSEEDEVVDRPLRAARHVHGSAAASLLRKSWSTPINTLAASRLRPVRGVVIKGSGSGHDTGSDNDTTTSSDAATASGPRKGPPAALRRSHLSLNDIRPRRSPSEDSVTSELTQPGAMQYRDFAVDRLYQMKQRVGALRAKPHWYKRELTEDPATKDLKEIATGKHKIGTTRRRGHFFVHA